MKMPDPNTILKMGTAIIIAGIILYLNKFLFLIVFISTFILLNLRNNEKKRYDIPMLRQGRS